MTHVDLIISDLIMPGADGLELLRDAARCQPRAALIILSSADADVLRTAAVVARERGLKVLGALRKPLRVDALAELLRGPATATLAIEAPASWNGNLHTLRSGHAQLLLQPRLNTDESKVHSVEALLRQPQAAQAEPLAQLLSAVNDLDERRELARTLISQALRLRCDCERLEREVPVAVSLGSLSLADLDLPALVDQVARQAGVPAGLLMIETADGVHADSAAQLEVLARLRMRGIRVTLEQFGAGSMSLLRLQRMPLTDLKLDRRLVEGFTTNRAQRTVVEHALKLAQALSLGAVACGVDTQQRVDGLRALNYSVLQGLAVAAPMTAADFDAWVPVDHVPGVTSLAAAEPASP